MELKQASVLADVPLSVQLISRDDIINNINAALELASDKQRAVIVRGFCKQIKARRGDKILSGEIGV